VEHSEAPAGIDTSKPNAARMYDYFLGGKDNFAVDRAAAEQLRAVSPELSSTAWANRRFHQRAARFIASAGVDQFIDVGCGLPTMENTHAVVQAVRPDARVVYVDYDPVVISHASALLANHNSNVSVTLGDLRDPDGVLAGVRSAGLLDLSRPCGLLISAVLHFVADAQDPYGAVSGLAAALAPGSYLSLSHVTADGAAQEKISNGVSVYRGASATMNPRSHAEVTRFFGGLSVVPPWPGAPAEVTRVSLWGLEQAPAADEIAAAGPEPWWCGVGRK
jgi:hypothetical protein